MSNFSALEWGNECYSITVKTTCKIDLKGIEQFDDDDYNGCEDENVNEYDDDFNNDDDYKNYCGDDFDDHDDNEYYDDDYEYYNDDE